MAQNPELDHLISAMSRYVIDLPRAIAIHLPRIKDGEVYDIEFIWGNKSFQSWRENPLKEGDLGSVTRRKFNELLPHLNKAWFDGQAIHVAPQEILPAQLVAAWEVVGFLPLVLVFDV